jgi:phosphopentomutase
MKSHINSGTKVQRSIIIILDSCGIGALPDAAKYGDITEHL